MTTYDKIRRIFDDGESVPVGMFSYDQLMEVFDAIPSEDKLFEEFILGAARAVAA